MFRRILYRILEENFFSFLDKEIKSRQYSVVHPRSRTATPTCASEADTASSSGGGGAEELLFDFSCGFVGYVGYEVRWLSVLRCARAVCLLLLLFARCARCCERSRACSTKTLFSLLLKALAHDEVRGAFSVARCARCACCCSRGARVAVSVRGAIKGRTNCVTRFN